MASNFTRRSGIISSIIKHAPAPVLLSYYISYFRFRMPSVSRGLYRWLFQRSAVLEDFADRLSHFWTVGLLLLLACIISWRQTYTSPIACWCPAEFTQTMDVYTHSYCWNSYAIQYQENVEQAMKDFNVSGFEREDLRTTRLPLVSQFRYEDHLERKATTTTLYQWLPLILCFQALLFKLPNIVLYTFHGFSGISFDKIAGLTAGYDNLNLVERQQLGRQISRYIYRWCKRFNSCPPCRLLTLLWLLVKILYLVNVIVQLSTLNTYITPGPPLENKTSYGDSIQNNMFENNASIWKESPVFPRFIMCQFNIFRFRNIYHYVVMCSLPANDFNERAYMFLWVWMMFVTIVTSVSLAVWLLKTLLPFMRKR